MTNTVQQRIAIMNATYQVPAHLRLVCRACTRQAGFEGTREEAEAAAKRAGWIIGESVICPKCPGYREVK